MGFLCRFLLVCICVGMAPTLAAQPPDWPNGERVAVSLSYDDALNSQLDNALPALEQANLKASFYLTLASPVVSERLDEWRALAQAGHELGNHTIFHPCSKSGPDRDWVPEHNNLDSYTLARMAQELTAANSFLQAIDGETERTLTPPCSDRQVSDGNYVEVFGHEFVAVKGAETGLPEGFVSYLMPEGQSGKELIAFVKAATESGGVANIVFHGVGGDYLSVSSQAHRELLRFLADHSDTYWTAPYKMIMKHLNQDTP